MTGNRLWVFGTIVLVAVIVVLGWFLGVSPKLAEASAATAQAASVASQNVALEAAVADLRATNDRIDELRDELDALRVSIPGSVRTGDLVDIISALAAAHGLEISNLTIADAYAYGSDPTDVVPDGQAPAEDTSGDGATDPTPVPVAPEGLYTVRIVLEARSTPGDFLLFVRDLQSATRLIIAPVAAFVADKQTGTLTAYAFVMPDATGTVDENPDADSGSGDSSTPTPDPTASATPTPTPAP